LERVVVTARWTEADARVAVEEFRSSGLSAREFGTRFGIHPVRLLRWAARLSTRATAATSLLLAPVHVTPVAPTLVEVVLGARVLRVAPTLDPDQIARLIRAVESA
jgi:hypothetical protein